MVRPMVVAAQEQGGNRVGQSAGVLQLHHVEEGEIGYPAFLDPAEPIVAEDLRAALGRDGQGLARR